MNDNSLPAGFCFKRSLLSDTFKEMRTRRMSEERRQVADRFYAENCQGNCCFLFSVKSLSKKILQEEAVKAATCALLYQSEATFTGCAKFWEQGLAAFRA